MRFSCPHCGQRLEVSKARTQTEPRFNHEGALALLDVGFSQVEVAQIFSVSRSAVHELKKRKRFTS